MFRINLATVSLITLLAPSLAGAVANPDLGSTRDVPGPIPGQYIVVLKDGTDIETASREITAKYNGSVRHLYKNALKGFSANLNVRRMNDVLSDPRVAMVSEDFPVSILGKGGPSEQLTQTVPTGIKRIKAVNKANKGTGVEVAVIDTGIDLNHPDLKASIIGSKNCVIGKGSADDQNGHGTHVAGTIAGVDNGQGVVGVAPGAKLWAVRVLDRNGSGSWSNVICGVDFVTSQASRIKVASMSLGGGGTSGSCASDPLHQAICNSVSAGVTYVVAAGNNGGDVKDSVPAAYPEVIAVSALADSNGAPCGGSSATSYGPDDTFASFSNFATLPGDASRIIGAPGVSIYSTWKGGGYNTISGTSMATPHVSGAVALYIKTHPGSTPAQVRSALLSLAEPGNVNWNGECAGATSSHADTTPTKVYGPVLRADTL